MGARLSIGDASMTDLEIIELASWLFFAWLTGFCLGLFVTTFRKFADKI